MEMVFNQVGRTWQAEFTVTADFNLHIEGGGRVYLYRRTSGGGWDSFYVSEGGEVFDYDISFAVFPKEVRIQCQKEPHMAVMTK